MAVRLESLSPLAPALRQRPFGLLCDVDGTLSPMAPTPAEAEITPRNRVLLEQLSRRISVAAVSGRDLPDLKRMVGIPSVICVGLHGLAWWFGGDDELLPEAEEYRGLTVQLIDELKQVVENPNVVTEIKTAGVAFHYRRAADHPSARASILKAIEASPAASPFEVLEGVLVVELRPALGVTKGDAVGRLADRLGLEGLIFAGDDITDIAGLSAARALRESGQVQAYGLAVQHPESPPEASAAADFSVDGVDGMEWLLGEMLKELER
jgi:trehalose 6-phosphate phosphatase